MCLMHVCRLEDDAEALRYYQESHRVYPVDMDVISWLGAFYVKNEVRNAHIFKLL